MTRLELLKAQAEDLRRERAGFIIENICGLEEETVISRLMELCGYSYREACELLDYINYIEAAHANN